MALFQQSVLKKYLNELDKDQLQHAWQIFSAHFHNTEIQENIRNAKEEEYQEGFVRDLFVTVFGYTLKPQPDFNLVLEKKTEADATKSDGALLRTETVIGVIELKDTDTTELDSIEKQVFGYKHKHKNCTYVITSNFEKLRFYINDSIDYEEFDLFNLTQNEFSLLYLCLQQKHIEQDIPLKMKQASVAEEEGVTKKLYADYSNFKQRLFNNISELNPQYDKLEIFKKTQKLLDRFLFILFAEDRLLVPPNSVRVILADWEKLRELDNYVPLYDRFLKYFGYLNKGQQGKQYDIYAYNGGLFADDEILDNIKIDDRLLYEGTKGLSNYDFESEVDVNILGHIFEHSLSEIEEVQAELEGKVVEKTKTKRKKDGVFYTPRYITKYIVENTVGELCRQIKLELNITDDEFSYRKTSISRENKLKKLNGYREWLLQLTICDPACGSGAFLNQALEYLIAEHRYVDELRAKLLGEKMVMNEIEIEILANNLFGVDINEEAIEIARLSLWLRTAQKGRKLSDLSKNIKCGNSLIDDPAVAGDKAFNWQKEFPTIFRRKEKNTFHITFATHYSRRNERMEKYKVPHREGFWMNEEAELLITGFIRDVVTENKFHVLAYNICGDHVHMLLVAEEEELPEIMRKIKGKSAQRFKEHLGIDKEEKFHLWQQKYSTTWLYTQEQYLNTLQYIQQNRQKHDLPFCKGLQPLADSMLTTEEAANAIEYKGGFDVVIGNPPYATKIFSEFEMNFYKQFYLTAKYQLDLYLLFIEKCVNIFKGKIGLITPNSWLKNMTMNETRSFLLKNIHFDIIVANLPNVFEDASVDSLIFIGSKERIQSPTSIQFLNEKQFLEKHTIDQDKFSKNENYVFTVEANEAVSGILERMRKSSSPLRDFFETTRGVNPYDSYRGQSKEIITAKAYHADFKKDETFIPEIRGKHIDRYLLQWDGKHYISYGPWLAAPRDPKFFKNERILFRQVLGERLICTVIDDEIIIDQSIFIALPKEDSIIASKYVLSLLTSKLGSLYFKFSSNEFDELFPKIKLGEFNELPIKVIAKDEQLPFIAKADIMLSKNKELQEIKQQFLKLLYANKGLLEGNKGLQPLVKREEPLAENKQSFTIPRKLQDWPALSFKNFLKELTKQKIKLSLAEQTEWMTYFEEQKVKANAIKHVIDTTDKEIDQMVYELYGLTEEEIKIVEGN